MLVLLLCALLAGCAAPPSSPPSKAPSAPQEASAPGSGPRSYAAVTAGAQVNSLSALYTDSYLMDTYVVPALRAGVLYNPWETPGDLLPDYLVLFFQQNTTQAELQKIASEQRALEEIASVRSGTAAASSSGVSAAASSKAPTKSLVSAAPSSQPPVEQVPAHQLEWFIQRFFSVGASRLRSSAYYVADTASYKLPPKAEPTLMKALLIQRTHRENTILLLLQLTDSSSSSSAFKYGELVLQQEEDGRLRYQSFLYKSAPLLAK